MKFYEYFLNGLKVVFKKTYRRFKYLIGSGKDIQRRRHRKECGLESLDGPDSCLL